VNDEALNDVILVYHLMVNALVRMDENPAFTAQDREAVEDVISSCAMVLSDENRLLETQVQKLYFSLSLSPRRHDPFAPFINSSLFGEDEDV
jgi:hypothetical protein